MSRFHGGQGKGAMRRHRDELYFRAVGRQLLIHDRGGYWRISDFDGRRLLCSPAPTHEFLRRGDSVDRIDFRSYAQESALAPFAPKPDEPKDPRELARGGILPPQSITIILEPPAAMGHAFREAAHQEALRQRRIHGNPFL